MLTRPSAPSTTPPLNVHATMVVPVCGSVEDAPRPDADVWGCMAWDRDPQAFRSMVLLLLCEVLEGFGLCCLDDDGRVI